MRRLVPLVLALVPTLAAADARRDVAALRRHHDRVQQRFLGWDADGAAVFRSVVCGGAAQWSCEIAVHRLGADGDDEPDVLLALDAADADEVEGRQHPVSAEVEERFVLDEAEALGELGELRRGSSIRRVEQAFGPVGPASTRVHLREIPDESDDGAVRLRLSLAGPRGVEIDLGEIGDAPWRGREHRVLAAHRSPDGRAVAFAVRFVDGALGHDDVDLAFVRADVPRVRARLAHAVGIRAREAGDMQEAGAMFVLATLEDPDDPWAWYDRAWIEAQHRDLSGAAAHLGTSMRLDPAQRRRACLDPAFAPLANTREGAALMQCGRSTS